ncbi:MAG: calcium/sodium antiporter [Candidatus Gracilibacteria bacterium]|nr:calcium/sodium antiporter [Candidatus Gracilibacteria bacterium]
MDYLFMLIGFVLLIKGADLLVDGASSFAKKLGISSLVIGLTVVAFGTSAPELVVNIMSSLSGKTDLAISNILGSNISNILLILGLTSIIYPISMPTSTVKKEVPFLIFVSALLFGLLFDGVLSTIDSMILVLFFVFFLYYTYSISRDINDVDEIKEIKKEGDTIIEYSKLKSIIYIVLGLMGLIFGGKLIVDAAVNIATNLGLPMSFIGVTIVAIGTSLPELAASIMAAIKKNTDMAIGGIIGSNIFNILWILGISGLINPLNGYNGMKLDLSMELLSTILILIAAFSYQKNILTRFEGSLLVLIYVGYIGYLSYFL